MVRPSLVRITTRPRETYSKVYNPISSFTNQVESLVTRTDAAWIYCIWDFPQQRQSVRTHCTEYIVVGMTIQGHQSRIHREIYPAAKFAKRNGHTLRSYAGRLHEN